MDLLDIVRARIRVKSGKFDESEIMPLICACKADLARVGIADKADDPLTTQAVVLYCKANFGFSEDSDKFQRAYESLRDAMSLSGDYGGDADAVP